jgi:hypothetical protein
MAQTEAVIRSTGGAAMISADEINRMAGAFQDITAFSDESVQAMQNILLTFTNIGMPIFKQTTQAVLDMSAALGTDLQGTAIQVGKALQDPILGITALRRVGVNFAADQVDVIKALVDTGRAAEAQQIILEELNKEFGGSAQAALGTYTGQLEQLKNQLSDIGELIGGPLIDFMSGALGPLNRYLNAYMELRDLAFELTDGIESFTPAAIIAAIQMRQLEVAAQGAGVQLDKIEAIRLANLPPSVEAAVEAVSNIGGQIAEAMPQIPSIWDQVFPDPATLAGKLQEQIEFIRGGGPQIVQAMNEVQTALAAGAITGAEATPMLDDLQEAALAMDVMSGELPISEAAKQNAADFGGSIADAKADIEAAQALIEQIPRDITIRIETIIDQTPGFQHGGSFTVGGPGTPDLGGRDNTMVAFPARTGERVDVTPQTGGGRRGGGGSTFIFNSYGDSAPLLERFKIETRHL